MSFYSTSLNILFWLNHRHVSLMTPSLFNSAHAELKTMSLQTLAENVDSDRDPRNRAHGSVTTLGFPGLHAHRLFPFTCQQTPGEWMSCLFLPSIGSASQIVMETRPKGIAEWLDSVWFPLECFKRMPRGATWFNYWVILFHKRGDVPSQG